MTRNRTSGAFAALFDEALTHRIALGGRQPFPGLTALVGRHPANQEFALIRREPLPHVAPLFGTQSLERALPLLRRSRVPKGVALLGRQSLHHFLALLRRQARPLSGVRVLALSLSRSADCQPGDGESRGKVPDERSPQDGDHASHGIAMHPEREPVAPSIVAQSP